MFPNENDGREDRNNPQNNGDFGSKPKRPRIVRQRTENNSDQPLYRSTSQKEDRPSNYTPWPDRGGESNDARRERRPYPSDRSNNMDNRSSRPDYNRSYGQQNRPSYGAGGPNNREERPSYGSSQPNRDRPQRDDRPSYGNQNRETRGYSQQPNRRFGDNNSERSYTPRAPRAFDRSTEGSNYRSESREPRPYNNRPSDGGGNYRGADSRIGRPERDNNRPSYGGSSQRNYGDRPPRTDRPSRSFDGGGRPYSNDNRSRSSAPRRSFNPYGKPQGRAERQINENLGQRAPFSPDKPYLEEPAKVNEIRLNRFIANAGICSRRKADDLIAAGKVQVNGVVISEMGFKVNSDDQITLDGKVVKREKLIYVLLNKPKDYITTMDDPEERKTVMQLIKNATDERVFPIGRLDRNTTGLLLFSNDGDLSMKLTHPSNHISKVYHVVLDRPLTRDHLNQVAAGVELEDGKADVDAVAFPSEDKREVGIEIHSGKNRIVRRIFESLGYKVEKLDRVSYAGLTKKDLPRGNWRYLTEKEVITLKHKRLL